ncbi:MAG: DUF6473 family protein [Paracoccaceae bacterium]|nr:DUF6473 family protein [Paracoccaceae bacterium]
MTYVAGGESALEYYPCRYGNSRVLFRGPRKQLKGKYVAFLGGTETYGRFIAEPYPALVEKQLGTSCVNFGSVNAGIDLYLNDPAVLEAAEASAVTVIQVMGAQNMSNRYYSVHPRRNDRFLRASERLQAVFPDVDFTEFHFNRHMLGRLEELSPERYGAVVEELRMAWLARMKHILTLLRGRVVLLWFAQKPPSEGPDSGLSDDPLYIDRSMIDALRPRVADVIEVPYSETARQNGTKGMVFNAFEACAAEELMGPVAHQEAAGQLVDVLAVQLHRGPR